MTKTDKLIKVFDFIAEYLYESEAKVDSIDKQISTETTEMEVKNNGEDSLKRAYTLMKKLDERDKQNVIVNSEVKKATEPLKEELNRIKKEYVEKLNIELEDEIKELDSVESKSSSKKKIVSKGTATTVEAKPIKSILEK
jgi:hypothetical protein